LALDVLEWGVILVMGAGILIWGPDKIPEMAKTLAQAKKQFDGATKQLQGITKELQTGLNTGNLNIDTLSNALIGAGTEAGIPGNPSPEEIAKATAGASGTTGAVVAPTEVPATPKKSADQMLIEMARSLRIDTKGKTREEISQAIMDVVSTKPAEAAPAPAAAVEAPAPVPEPPGVQTPAAEQQPEQKAEAPAAQ
jgi:Sec-independent protein translocase protein TatA